MSMYGRKAELIRERAEQAELKEKYGIEEEQSMVEVKVTNTTVHYIGHVIGLLIRVIAILAIAVLAATGCVALAYQEVREPLLVVVREAIDMVVSGFGR